LRRIGVLTSGGDAPGMNAAIRAVVRKGIYQGLEIWGVHRGFAGVISGDFIPMNLSSVADVIHRGGTILHTARSERFKTPEGQAEALANIRRAGIEGMVVIGGDGSFRGAKVLSDAGIPTVGIPGTIDNDIYGTELTIGFDTAVNTVVDAMNKIRDTATSHERTFVMEVMGRDSGFIAMAAGLAGGAESILIPEFPWTIEEVCERLSRSQERGKRHSLIIVAEGAGQGFQIGEEIQRKTGFDTRVTVLGHIQRGGTPTATDRTIASLMGAKAVDLLVAGEARKVVGISCGDVIVHDIDYVLSHKKEINRRLYDLAATLAI